MWHNAQHVQRWRWMFGNKLPMSLQLDNMPDDKQSFFDFTKFNMNVGGVNPPKSNVCDLTGTPPGPYTINHPI